MRTVFMLLRVLNNEWLKRRAAAGGGLLAEARQPVARAGRQGQRQGISRLTVYLSVEPERVSALST
jgi:hypothetical protein